MSTIPPLQTMRSSMPELTSLRFFAAAHVVLFHNFYLSSNQPLLPTYLQQTIGMGFTAVNFFFVLSGFILTTVYFKNEKPIDRKSFWIKRGARIYPLFLLALLLDAPRIITYFIDTYGVNTGLLKGFISFLGNVFLIQAWVPQITSSWNSPGWSLSNEAFFYLLFPFLLSIFARGSSRKSLKVMIIAFWASMFFISPFVFYFDAENKPALFTIARFFPLLHVFEFIFGIALGYMFRLKNESLLAHWICRWGDVVAVIFLFLSVTLKNLIPILYFHNGLFVPIYGVLIWSAASGCGFFSGLLSHRWLVFLGNASYAVYILHQPIKFYVLAMAERFEWEPSWQLLSVYLMVTLVVSIIAYLFVEEPSRKWITKRFVANTRL